MDVSYLWENICAVEVKNESKQKIENISNVNRIWKLYIYIYRRIYVEWIVMCINKDKHINQGKILSKIYSEKIKYIYREL